MPSCNWAFGCAIGLFVITLIIVLIILLGSSGDEEKEKVIIMPAPSAAPTTNSSSAARSQMAAAAGAAAGAAAPRAKPCGQPSALSQAQAQGNGNGMQNGNGNGMQNGNGNGMHNGNGNGMKNGNGNGMHNAGSGSGIKELHSAKEAADILKSAQPALVMFYADFCGHCKQMMPDFEQAAKEASSKTGVIIAKVESGKMKDMASVASLLPAINGFPTMCTNFEGGGIKAHVGRKDLPAIRALMQKGSSGASRLHMQSTARKVRAAAGKRVMMELGSMQEACDALKGKDKVIIMAYADWCGYCKAMKADYESLLDKVPADVTVGRLNSSVVKPGEMCDGVEEIKAFPTTLFNNGSKITKVMGKQTLQSLLEMVKK